MSLAIDIDRITHVLLTDGWHAVAHESFNLDAYEYGHNVTLSNGETSFVMYRDGGIGGVNPTGFEFKDAATAAWVYGPLVSVIGVRAGARTLAGEPSRS